MKVEKIDKAILIWGPISEEALESIRKNKTVVVVPENRPYLIGINYNVPLLKKEKIKFVYCTDNMLGWLFYKNKVRKTYLFYKKKEERGIIGWCGSLYVILLNSIHNIPVEIFAENKVKYDFVDKDASTINGKSFILKEDNKFVEEPSDEFVEWSILNRERCSIRNEKN